jgi:hypothetical protein
MRVLRPSSVEEYASWYLHRERRKGDTRPVPSAPKDQLEVMWERHGIGKKMREWFSSTTRWHLALLDRDDLARLVFLESDWTKREGLVIPKDPLEPDYRILERVAENAMASDYFSRPDAHKHKAYYDALASATLRLEGDDRIAICSAEENEIRQNPSARYYLLDGVGRSLPYMVLSKAPAITYAPVESFVAER